jgi:hypothetical protein
MVATQEKAEGTINEEIDLKKTKILEQSPSRTKAGPLAGGPAED